MAARTCQWFPDGKRACGEPAGKSVTTWLNGDCFVTWLCDAHHADPSLREHWDGQGARYEY